MSRLVAIKHRIDGMSTIVASFHLDRMLTERLFNAANPMQKIALFTPERSMKYMEDKIDRMTKRSLNP